VRAADGERSGRCVAGVGRERMSLGYTPLRRVTDALLRAKLREVALRIPADACRATLRMAPKKDYRVEWLHRLECLAVRRRERDRLAVPWVPKAPVLAPSYEAGIVFVGDTLASGYRIRCSTVVCVCSHECLSLVAALGLPRV
jgi:hypothetical protein